MAMLGWPQFGTLFKATNNLKSEIYYGENGWDGLFNFVYNFIAWLKA